jgi:phage baseplate assembly protein W
MSYDLQLLNGDISFGSDGNPMIVQNTAKLAQDVSKIMLTPLGSDPGNVQYGTKLRGLMGKPMDFSTVQGIVANTCSQALSLLQSLQATQTTIQTMTYSELIDHVDAIAVIPTSNTGIEVQIAIVSQAGERLVFAQQLAGQGQTQ